MFRFEYDTIVARHGYREDQPWDLGGIRLLHIDGANGDLKDAERIRNTIDELQKKLAVEWAYMRGVNCDRPGAYGRYMDNHYGYTVTSEGSLGDPDVTYQLRFSDGSLYVWLMPNGSLIPWRSSKWEPKMVLARCANHDLVSCPACGIYAMMHGKCPKCRIYACRHQLPFAQGYDLSEDAQ